MRWGLCLCSYEAESHVIDNGNGFLYLIHMAGEEILQLIYITCGEFLLQLLPVSGGNDCHSLVI